MGIESTASNGDPSASGGGEAGSLIRLPKKSIQSEYLMTVLLDKRTFTAVLSSLQRIDDPRPQILARQVINGILDDDIRYALLDAFDKRLKEISNSSENADSKALNNISTSQDLVGEVNSYLDEFFALHKGQEIGDV
jgi:hypothetical protein